MTLTNGVDELDITADGDYVFAVRLAKGDAYDVAIGDAPTFHTCTLEGAQGTIGAGDVIVGLTCKTRIVMAVTGSTLRALRHDPVLGTLEVLGSVTVGGSRGAIAAHSTLPVVYVIAGANVETYDFSPSDGSLTLRNSRPGATTGLWLDASRGRLFATDYDANKVSVFDVDETGGLTAVAGSPFDTGVGPYGVVATGTHLYVINNGGKSISAFAIATDGALTSVTLGSLTLGARPSGAVLCGSVLYVANYGADVAGFTISSLDGTLAQVAGLPALTNVTQVLASPGGARLYAFETGAYKLAAFDVDLNTGGLTHVTGSPFSMAIGAWEGAFDPSGEYVYLSSRYDNFARAFAVDGSGALTENASIDVGVDSTTFSAAAY